eukprot:CAMPEP_0119306922 /NCGR_PEP_ID=MMETSP1333-20130426/7557_1 /TAXON_ID=418940 /ORGANISM="Scyphosphaera apsteinii, Strain RCC1455" /LENGTH=93 /DNA_ID=CAMNT_0007310353 /DNA_START=82 /DNA_END=363 /DNA_ORIENTATION=+
MCSMHAFSIKPTIPTIAAYTLPLKLISKPVVMEESLKGLAKVPTPALLLTGAGVALEIFAPLVTSSGSPPTGLSIAVAGLVFLKLGAEQLGDT